MTNRWHGRIYNLGSRLADPAACAEYRAKGYTDVCALVISSERPLYNNPPYDFLKNPDGFLERVQRYADAGLRCIPVIGFEGNKPAQQRYGSTWLSHVRAFVRATRDHPAITCYAPGLEVGEWTDGDGLLDMMAVISFECDHPIVPHFNGAEWGPSSDGKLRWSGGQRRFWETAQSRCPNTRFAVGFQARHVSRANGGFGPVEKDAIGHMSGLGSLLLPGRLGGLGIGVIWWEGFFNGRDPVANVAPEAEARAFGKRMIALGYLGSMNGV